MKNLLIFFLSVLCCCSVHAQIDYYSNDSIENNMDSVMTYENIFEDLSAYDSLTCSVITINQDSNIIKVISKNISTELQEVKGFRIQIYSSNKGAYAKTRSFKIKETLLKKHPAMEKDIYVTYTSPFWKVRIGNCQTREQAQSLRTWIKSEFPEFANETYIVPSTVLIP